jgi:gluconolactonase
MKEQESPRAGMRVARRDTLKAFGALGLTGILGSQALAQSQSSAPVGAPPSVLTTPPRQWGPGAPPAKFPDEDVIVIDPSFRSAIIGNTQIRRVWTGALWAEGPAWSNQGHYLVFSDVVANIQYRFSWDSRQVSAFRNPSFNSNGNSFDFQGRQLSTQDFFRRVVRWEHDGTMTVIADQFEGKPLNSPNDIVPHPDGSIWFTDPPYGASLSEGHPDVAGGPTNPDGVFNPRVGTEGLSTIGGQKRESPNGVYRWDPSGRLDLVVTEDQLKDPNGICFTPDYKTLLVCSTGKGPGDAHDGGTRTIFAFDVQGAKAVNGRSFLDMTVDGLHLGPDGVRTDTAGRIWCSASGPLGYAGVLVYDSKAKLIGRIRLPEGCANLSFGGPKRNQLFMTASQSLYLLQVQAQGAAPG